MCPKIAKCVDVEVKTCNDIKCKYGCAMEQKCRNDTCLDMPICQKPTCEDIACQEGEQCVMKSRRLVGNVTVSWPACIETCDGVQCRNGYECVKTPTGITALFYKVSQLVNIL